MLYYKNKEWHIYPFMAHYTKDGQKENKYTDNKKWWIDFVQKWRQHENLVFEDVVPTENQLIRLIEINNADIPEGFKAEVSAYVEIGKIIDSENLFFTGFTEWPEALEIEKTKFKVEINIIRYKKLYQENIPYTFPGDSEPDGVQMRDETDRQNIQDFVLDASNKDPETIMYWMPVSNVMKAMTASEAIDMGQTLKARGDSIMGYSWTLKGQITTAETFEELQAIDIYSGWPE